MQTLEQAESLEQSSDLEREILESQIYWQSKQKVTNNLNRNIPMSSLPEDSMNITEIIEYYNYKVENHYVITEDGYILQMQRIPCGRFQDHCESRPPVLLQHGFIDSAHTWVMNLPHQSLGFILADEGFDVWLSNSRGNRYSKAHVKYTVHDKEFWDFSWDEMAQYDLPAIIQFIILKTGYPTLGYVGHSQGTEIAFARFNQDDEITRRVNSVVALAPIAYLGHVETIFQVFAKFPNILRVVLNLIGHGEFLPSTKFTMWLAELFCTQTLVTPLCSNFIFYLAGFDVENFNQSRLSVYMSHLPAGTSVRNLLHYTQAVNSDKFMRYDFGQSENVVRYGQANPPEYSVSNLSLPVALLSGGHDTLSAPEDVQRLAPLFPNLRFTKSIDYYNHLDFVWGNDADGVIYRDVVDFLKRYSSK
jgi:pimeloyl-ACP methyl ester carboxylesterase